MSVVILNSPHFNFIQSELKPVRDENNKRNVYTHYMNILTSLSKIYLQKSVVYKVVKMYPIAIVSFIISIVYLLSLTFDNIGFI